jgi:16S rRNA processing protein RimM
MIVLGRIVAPYGIQGWIKIHPFGDDPLAWRTMPQWWVCSDSDGAPETWRPLVLRGCRMQGRSLVAAFAEVKDRNAAEALDGLYVGAPREALPATAEGEYYWADLVGLGVVNRAGESLGTVSSLLSTGAHDVLQVQEGDREYLIPFVAAYVDDVDVNARRIRVDWQKDW